MAIIHQHLHLWRPYAVHPGLRPVGSRVNLVQKAECKQALSLVVMWPGVVFTAGQGQEVWLELRRGSLEEEVSQLRT